MSLREREILERTVSEVSTKIVEMTALLSDVQASGAEDGREVERQIRLARLELLKVKTAAERGLEELVLECVECQRRVHYVPGLSALPGRWAHAEPAPHDEPVV